MIRVAFINHTSALYGAPRSLISLVNSLDTRLIEPLVITSGGGDFTNEIDGKAKYFILRKHPKSKHIPGILLCRVIYLCNLYLTLRKEKASLIYVNTIAQSTPLVVSLLLRIPAVVHVRELFFPRLLWIRKILFKKVPQKYIAISEAVKQSLQGEGIPASKIALVYNGIDIEFYSRTESGSERLELQCSRSCGATVGFIGQITPLKAAHLFIKAALKITEKAKDTRFLMVGGYMGDDKYRNHIRNLAQNLDGKLVITGYKGDVRRYIDMMDLLLVTSLEESFGRVIIEAMAQKKPVIALNSGGPAEIVLDGVTGYVLEITDDEGLIVHALAEKALELILDRDKRIMMGLHGYRRALDYFNLDRYSRECQKIILECVQDKN